MSQFDSTLEAFKERQQKIEALRCNVEEAAIQIEKGLEETGLTVSVMYGDHRSSFNTEIMVYDKETTEVLALLGWKIGSRVGTTQMVEQILNAMKDKIQSFK
jgi:hypothetical protein